MKKSLLLITGFISSLSITAPAWAEKEIRAATDLALAVSSLPEAKLSLTQSFTFPFLQGAGPLTADNNINTALTAELSPISLNMLAGVTWTPIAFFQLAAGAMLGSGWDINLFGSDIYGIGINQRGTDGKEEINGSAFEGCFWGVQGGGAFQFDAAALVPGDWHHLVFRTYHQIAYKGFSAASDEDTWVFENEQRENRNGFTYYGNFLLGYQMPLFFNAVGLMAEVDVYLYDTPNRSTWGDELGRWTFSALGSFTITPRLNAALIVQCRTKRNYEDESLFYQDRILDTSNPIRLEFYRVAVIISYKLR